MTSDAWRVALLRNRVGVPWMVEWYVIQRTRKTALRAAHFRSELLTSDTWRVALLRNRVGVPWMAK